MNIFQKMSYVQYAVMDISEPRVPKIELPVLQKRNNELQGRKAMMEAQKSEEEQRKLQVVGMKELQKVAEKQKTEAQNKLEKEEQNHSALEKAKKQRQEQKNVKEQAKMSQHYPIDKVLNEEFLKENLQKYVYDVFGKFTRGETLTVEEERGFKDLITDAFWLTNKSPIYSGNKRNTMNSLQSYVIFSNILMMLQHTPQIDFSSFEPQYNVSPPEILGLTLDWCQKVIQWLDSNIENGEIRTFYTPKLSNNGHLRDHLFEGNFGKNRIADIENYFNVRKHYAHELGLNYHALNMPDKYLTGAPKWCSTMPIIANDENFAYNEEVPESLLGKKICLVDSDSKQPVFYRIIGDKMAGDIVMHKLVDPTGKSFFVHIDLSDQVAVEKIDPRKAEKESVDTNNENTLESLSHQLEKQEKQMAPTQWRPTTSKPKDGRRVRVCKDDKDCVEGTFKNGTATAPLTFKPYNSETYENIESLEDIMIEDKPENQIDIEQVRREASTLQNAKELEMKEEEEIAKEIDNEKPDQGYVDGRRFKVKEICYPEFEPKTIFFDPRAFAFFIDILSPVLYEGDEVVFKTNEGFSHGKIKSISVDANHESIYNIGSFNVNEEDIVGINHKHLNTGLARRDTQPLENESFEEISKTLVHQNGLVFPYRTQRRHKFPTGTYVGLKLNNASSKFEFAQHLDIDEVRYFQTALPHPGLLTNFREENGMEKLTVAERYKFLKNADLYKKNSIPRDPESKGLTDLAEKIEEQEVKLKDIKRKRAEISIQNMELEAEMTQIRLKTEKSTADRKQKITILLKKKKDLKDKIHFYEGTPLNDSKKQSIKELEQQLSNNVEETIKEAEKDSDKSEIAYVTTKNRLKIAELQKKKDEYMMELVQIEEEEKQMVEKFNIERGELSKAALAELNGLHKIHGIHYTDENPLLTFMLINDEGKSYMQHIPRQEIKQTPVNQYSVFYDLFESRLNQRWDMEIESGNKEWECVPKNPFMFYFYLTDEENEPVVDEEFVHVIRKIKGVFRGKLIKDWSKTDVKQELGVTDYIDNLHFDSKKTSVENYQKLIPIPRTNGKVYRIVLNRTMLSEKLLGLELTTGVHKDNWDNMPPHARTVVNGWSGYFAKAIKENTYTYNRKPPKLHDVLLKVNDEEVLEYADLERLLSVGNQEQGDEITLLMFRYEHPEMVFPDGDGDTFEMDMSNNYEFSLDGKFAFVLMLGMVTARVFKKFSDDIDFTSHDTVKLYVDIYEWMALRQEKYLKSYTPWVPYRMAVSDTNNKWQLPSFKQVKTQTLRNLNIRMLGERPVCSACQKGYETYYGNIFYNKNVKNFLPKEKKPNMLVPQLNLNMLYAQPRLKFGHHRNTTALCIESLEAILDEMSTKAQRDANGWFLNWMGTWQEAQKKYEKFDQKQQEWFDNMDPRYNVTNWLYGTIIYKLDIYIKKIILNCADVPIDEDGNPIKQAADGMGAKKNNTTEDIEGETNEKLAKKAIEEAIRNAKEGGEGNRKILIEMGKKAGKEIVTPARAQQIAEEYTKVNTWWESTKNIASGALSGLKSLINKIWTAVNALAGGVKSVMQSIMCVFYKLIMIFCKSQVFRVIILKVVDQSFQRICEQMNVKMGNYQMSNDGNKYDETTGTWLKMSEEEMVIQARKITLANKKKEWYDMRVLGLLLDKIGAGGSFAEKLKKLTDVQMMGQNGFFTSIMGFLMNIPVLGDVLKMTGLDAESLTKAITGAVSLCWEEGWEHLKSLHTSTMDLSKLWDVIKTFNECMEKAEAGETIMIEKGAAPGGTAPYLNYAWERIVYNIPFYAIAVLNEVQRDVIENKWNKEFLNSDDVKASEIATKSAHEEAGKRSLNTRISKGFQPLGIASEPSSSSDWAIQYKLKYEEYNKKVDEIMAKKEDSNKADLAQLRFEEQKLNEELAQLKVYYLLDKRRNEVKKSLSLEGKFDQVVETTREMSGRAINATTKVTNDVMDAVVPYGAWKKLREYVLSLGEDEVRAQAYVKMQIGILTWMVPGGDDACQVTNEEVEKLQSRNEKIKAALRCEEKLFKFIYSQTKLKEFKAESERIQKDKENDSEDELLIQTAWATGSNESKREELHGTVKPNRGKYVKWALGEESYLPGSSNQLTIKKYQKLKWEIPFNLSKQHNQEMLESIVERLKSELDLSNNILKIIQKYASDPFKHFERAESMALINLSISHLVNLYNVFFNPHQKYYIGRKKWWADVRAVGNNVNIGELAIIDKIRGERGIAPSIITKNLEHFFTKEKILEILDGYIKDVEERRSALNKVYKYRTNQLNLLINTPGTKGEWTEALTAEDYINAEGKILKQYEKDLVRQQENTKHRLWVVKKRNLMWWGGAILVAGAVGIFVTSGGAAAMLTQVAQVVSGTGTVLAELATTAAVQIETLIALISEKTASGMGKLTMDKIEQWGGTVYSGAMAAVQAFTDELQDPENQKFLMLSGACVGAYGMMKIANSLKHSTDHTKHFTLTTCFQQNSLWERIFREKVMLKVDEFRTKLDEEQQLDAIKRLEEHPTALVCDETKDSQCFDDDDWEISHPHMLSIQLRRNFCERATVDIDWAGCDHFLGSDLPFLDVYTCVRFFEKYKALTVSTESTKFLWMEWTHEYGGVADKEKEGERKLWAKVEKEQIEKIETKI